MVGSQVDNPLAAGAAGAGVNIVGGALLDSLTSPNVPSQPIAPSTTPTQVIVQREVQYVEVPAPARHKPKGKAKGWYKKRQYKEYFNAGYTEGYTDGYYAAYREMNDYTYQKLEDR